VYHEVEHARDKYFNPLCHKDPAFEAIFTKQPIDLDKVLEKLRSNRTHSVKGIREKASAAASSFRKPVELNLQIVIRFTQRLKSLQEKKPPLTARH
jgi:hypothetical protein